MSTPFRTFARAFALTLLPLLACGASPAGAEPVTLKFATQNAETAWSTVNGLVPWLKKMESESNGALNIELYANQTLAKGNQAWQAVRNSIADMAWITIAMYPGMNPLLEVTGMPGLGFTNALESTDRTMKLYDSLEGVRKPFAGNKILAIYTANFDSSYLLSKKPIRTLEDLQGLKIRCTAGTYVRLLSALGAVPVVMPMPDVYMSLEKGTIDGLICDVETFMGFRFYDVARYILKDLPKGVTTFAVAMNTRAYDRLPEDAKKAVDANSGRAGSMWLAEHFSYNSRELEKEIIARNLAEIHTLSPEEKARWTKLVLPLWDEWLADLDKKGIKGGREALEIMQGK